MCKQEKPLLRSHFMPASIYPLCGNPEFPPVRVMEEAVMPTSRQVQDHLLCWDCEGILNSEGENWVVPLLAELNGPFPLREMLLKQKPIETIGDVGIYAAAQNPEIDVPKLTHFGIGLFFKAAVHSWRGGIEKPWIALEPDDIEGLRLYLLGEADLPPNIALSVTIDSSPICLPAFHDAYRVVNDTFTVFCTFVPGLVYNLFIGADAQERMKGLVINGNPLAPVQYTKMAVILRNLFRERSKGPRIASKLKETTAEIEARGLSVKLGD
jgi:hypothetical protein